MTTVRKAAISARDYARSAASRLTRSASRREDAAVQAGISKYRQEGRLESDLYLLRRNVHMIEKGLTMRPRRAEFALDYITLTVETFARIAAIHPSGEEPGEFDWMRAVLEQFFDATRSSEHEEIRRSRERFLIVAKTGAGASGPHHPGLTGDEATIAQLEALASSRRSVRWFEQRPVDRTLVDRAVAVAAESPTACNRQPYRFEIFDDPASVRAVASIPMGTRGYADQIPGIVVVIGDLSAFFDERDRHLIYIDSCLASMGLIYALEAQGVASCCINWPDIPARDARMRRLLGLRPFERVVMLIAYGYADHSGMVPFSAKRELASVRQFRELSVDV